MVDDLPLLPHPFIQVGGEDSAFLSRVALLAGDVLRTDHPGHLPGHLNLNLGEIELHREGVVEDQDPGISHSRPADPQGPARMNAGDILLLRPDPIHPRNVQAFEGLIELLVRPGDLLDPFLEHVPPLVLAEAKSYPKTTGVASQTYSGIDRGNDSRRA